jgi:hypothetical protein
LADSSISDFWIGELQCLGREEEAALAAAAFEEEMMVEEVPPEPSALEEPFFSVGKAAAEGPVVDLKEESAPYPAEAVKIEEIRESEEETIPGPDIEEEPVPEMELEAEMTGIDVEPLGEETAEEVERVEVTAAAPAVEFIEESVYKEKLEAGAEFPDEPVTLEESALEEGEGEGEEVVSETLPVEEPGPEETQEIEEVEALPETVLQEKQVPEMEPATPEMALEAFEAGASEEGEKDEAPFPALDSWEEPGLEEQIEPVEEVLSEPVPLEEPVLELEEESFEPPEMIEEKEVAETATEEFIPESFIIEEAGLEKKGEISKDESVPGPDIEEEPVPEMEGEAEMTGIDVEPLDEETAEEVESVEAPAPAPAVEFIEQSVYLEKLEAGAEFLDEPVTLEESALEEGEGEGEEVVSETMPVEEPGPEETQEIEEVEALPETVFQEKQVPEMEPATPEMALEAFETGASEEGEKVEEPLSDLDSWESPGLEEKIDKVEDAFPESVPSDESVLESEEEKTVETSKVTPPEPFPLKESPKETEKEKSVAEVEKEPAEAVSLEEPVPEEEREQAVSAKKFAEVPVEKEEESYLLPNIEITSVEGFTRKGELVDIVVEGISTGCKSIFLRVQNDNIKYFKNVYPSSGRFIASFEDIIKSMQMGNVDQVSVTAISLANADVSDTWRGKLHCLGKEDEAIGEGLEKEGGSESIPSEVMSLEESALDEEEEAAVADEMSEEEEEKESITEKTSFPNIEITDVRGFTQKGKLVDIVVEGTSVGCKSIFLKIQSENIKYFKNIYPSSKKFRESFQDILKENQISLTEKISVTAISLANSEIFDTWGGKLEFAEKKRGRPKKTGEDKT